MPKKQGLQLMRRWMQALVCISTLAFGSAAQANTTDALATKTTKKLTTQTASTNQKASQTSKAKAATTRKSPTTATNASTPAPAPTTSKKSAQQIEQSPKATKKQTAAAIAPVAAATPPKISDTSSAITTSPSTEATKLDEANVSAVAIEVSKLAEVNEATQSSQATRATAAIQAINQRFARVPVAYCPRQANGYGLEVRYDKGQAPVVTQVYGRAFVAGLQPQAQLLAINGQPVRTQREFNALIYQGQSPVVANLASKIQLSVLQNEQTQEVVIEKGSYCLSNLAVESERHILRLNSETKGSGYSAKSETTAYVDAGFLLKLTPSERLTLAAVMAAEQYRYDLQVKRGKKGMIFGQIFGTLVTFTTGIPITEMTTSGSTALSMQEDGAGALRPAASYGYYLGLTSKEMHQNLEKLATFKTAYRAQGKRYDWRVRDDLSEFDAAAQEVKALLDKGANDVMLKPKLFADKNATKDGTGTSGQAEETMDAETGVGSY